MPTRPATLAVALGALALGALAALDETTMAQHLSNGAGILGTFSTSGSLTDWMAAFDDSTPLVSMNIPGTHDSCAWRVPGLQSTLLQTQDFALFDQLNAGIRFFDLRFGDNGNGVLGLYHADTLLDTKATLEDVLWGFYHFLDAHPTEALVLSIKVDHGDTSAALQAAVHDMITAPGVADYWSLDTALPATLGAARRKAVLFRRFTFDGALPFGIDVAAGWVDNNADFAVGQSAWVEDLYQINLGTPQQVVDTKVAAVTAHLGAAAGGGNTTELFVTFASGGGATTVTYVTPRLLAVGDTNLTGVNARVRPLLQNDGARRGVVLYDYFHTPADLVLATIGSDRVVANKSTLSTTTSGGTSPTASTNSRPIGAARANAAAGGSAAVLVLAAALSAVLI